MESWEIVHQWNWFRGWCEEEYHGKRHLTERISSLLEDLGRSEASLLDCSCGLGFQSLSLHRAGFQVTGADRSPFAVDKARRVAQAQGCDIEFLVAQWHELPQRTAQRFDAVFCDALTWLPTHGELLAALRGLHGVLKPEGILIFQGFPEGLSAEACGEALDAWWESTPQSVLNWRHTEEGVSCTSMTVGSRGEDYFDWNLLYLVEEEGTQRLEHLSLRESTRWHWQRLREIVREAGFLRLATHHVQAWSEGGRPAGLNSACAA